MLTLIKQVIRLLMVTVHHSQKRQKGSGNVKGGLLVSVSAETAGSPSDHVCGTVAAAGYWCSECTFEDVQREVTQNLDSSISIGSPTDPEQLSEFLDRCGPLRFHISFQVTGRSRVSEGDWLKTEQLLHRLSLVHAQVEIYFSLKLNEAISQKIYRCRAHWRFALLGGCIGTESALYLLPGPPAGPSGQCTQLHPVPGAATPLLLPHSLVEMGLCGTISLLPAAALSPCVAQNPNWPAQLVDIRIFLYGPSNLPLLCDAEERPLSFLRDFAHLLSWKEFGLSGVRCSENSTEAGCLLSEMVYTVEGSEQSAAVGQTLLLFLFLQHSDPFCSQLSDFVVSEELLVQNLDRILQHNQERVKVALHSLLQCTLSGSLKRQKAQAKMQAAIPVILSSLSSVVSSSSSLAFRTTCLNSMKVQDTQELGITLKQALLEVTQNRFMPSRKCNNKCLRRASGDGDVDGSDHKHAPLRLEDSSRSLSGALDHKELGVEASHSQTGGESTTVKKPRVAGVSTHPSAHKQTHTGPWMPAQHDIPGLSQTQPTAAAHTACSDPVPRSLGKDNQQEDQVWLHMFDWDC
ncbi:type 2 DNA topoisomerase 6 subunit B-like isoform X3 [Paramormyrops kingsleyae]|uniref:Uncharacterized protein n=1 Tax=Paramormyrops kingsleyae TaxID=1676925 RepID=A0A3B3Q235_9TELE|nr:type 2 DNA topoisomerase 6 subunit B-like isoform X3 [Paramormyrops kingsleyae]